MVCSFLIKILKSIHSLDDRYKKYLHHIDNYAILV